MTAFSCAEARRFASTAVDDVLAQVDRDANTFIHVVHGSPSASAKILEHFALPLHIAGTTSLDLDASSDRYLFKRYRFIEPAPPGPAASTEPTAAGVLIRGSETDRLTESTPSSSATHSC